MNTLKRIDEKIGISKYFTEITMYDIPNRVVIKHPYVSISLKLMQLTIISWTFIYSFYYMRSYQRRYTGTHATLIKPKGIISKVFYDDEKSMHLYIYDILDLVPNQESDSLFLITRYTNLVEQVQGDCSHPSDKCETNDMCQENTVSSSRFTILNGFCEHHGSKTVKTCSAVGWCDLPQNKHVESSMKILENLDDLGNFTLFIKNYAYFNDFGYRLINIPATFTKDALKSCRYMKNDPINKHCPVFSADYIVKSTTGTHKNIFEEGGVIIIDIQWNCNFDFNWRKCQPIYNFYRADTLSSSPGFNFWTLRGFYNSTEKGNTRKIVKYTGIEFKVQTTVLGRRFDSLEIFLTLGCALGFWGLASMLCDYIILNLVYKKELYKKAVFISLDDALRMAKSSPSQITLIAQ